jgi:hypothetical protein
MQTCVMAGAWTSGSTTKGPTARVSSPGLVGAATRYTHSFFCSVGSVKA